VTPTAYACRTTCSRLCLLNHPQRQLTALAILARDWSRLQRASGKSSIDAANDLFITMIGEFKQLFPPETTVGFIGCFN
jgi:hypothetical protein